MIRYTLKHEFIIEVETFQELCDKFASMDPQKLKEGFRITDQKIFKCLECGVSMECGKIRCETCFNNWLYKTKSYQTNQEVLNIV